MNQIRSTQIIPIKEISQNPFVAPPRDLTLNTKESNGNTTTAPNLVELLRTASRAEGVASHALDYGAALNDATAPPGVPAIIGVKKQSVNMHDDGTSTIDLVLNVQDIPGITEYDIRVAKDAGTL